MDLPELRWNYRFLLEIEELGLNKGADENDDEHY